MKQIIIMLFVFSVALASCGTSSIKDDMYNLAYTHTTYMLERDPSFAKNICDVHNKTINIMEIYSDLKEMDQRFIQGVYDAVNDYCKRTTSL